VPARDPDCIFCAIASGAAPAEIIDSDEHTVTLMDINPATKGHALVIPREHTEDLMSISEADLCHTAVAAQRVAKRMEETLAPDGFNLINACRVAAWQTVFHFHIHVVPRYEGDPLKLPWIPRGADMDEVASIAATIRNGGEG